MFTNLSAADLMAGYLETFGAPAPDLAVPAAAVDVADAASAEESDSDTPVAPANVDTDVTADAAGA